MAQTLATATGRYTRGQVYAVPQPLGTEWTAKGLARPSTEPPAYVQAMLARLDEGAGERCLFLPFVGEFGHQIMSHIRLVHWHRASHKVVCCRPGEEVLYPSAVHFVTDWTDPIPDAERVASIRDNPPTWPDLVARSPAHRAIKAGCLTPDQELYAINPTERIPFRPRLRGLEADVCLGIRQRQYAPERNWAHWQHVADALTAAGYSFAVIGHKATSLDLAGQRYHAGDYDTDAALELLRHCRLYIGTDSGASHLAATVGAPMLIFRESASGSRDLVPRMREVNRAIKTVDGWNEPRAVIAAALARLGSA